MEDCHGVCHGLFLKFGGNSYSGVAAAEKDFTLYSISACEKAHIGKYHMREVKV